VPVVVGVVATEDGFDEFVEKVTVYTNTTS
jgi:hypothetical protein